MEHTVRVEVDQSADAAYVRLTSGKVARSVEVSPDVVVDLDEMNVVVGVEMLHLDAELPFQKLVSDHHVRSETVDVLRHLQPSISRFLVRSEATRSMSENHSSGSVNA